MKKVIKMGVVMSLLVASMSAFAQNTGKAEYPRYGFWSNWSVGFSFDLNNQAAMNGNSYDAGWRRATNAGMDIFAQQKLNHAFDWRLRFGFPSFWAPLQGYKGYYNDRHMSLTLDILWSINNSLLGYDPDRRLNLYVFAGGGLALSGNSNEEMSLPLEDYEHVGIVLDGGAGVSYRLTEKHNIFAEYGYDINGDAPHPEQFFSNALHNTNRIFRLGYFYCFGVRTSPPSTPRSTTSSVRLLPSAATRRNLRTASPSSKTSSLRLWLRPTRVTTLPPTASRPSSTRSRPTS